MGRDYSAQNNSQILTKAGRLTGQLGSFLEELDVLLSSFPEDGTPLIVPGDFSIYLEKPQAADFHTLLASFDLKRVSTAATHKSEADVSKLLLCNRPTTCPLDPIPTNLLQASSSSVVPTLKHIINTSLHTGTFPTAFKQARNNLLDNNQSGFKCRHSTETALLSVIEALRLARAASKSSVLILLDLSAAFDTVNHQILLSILKMKGISGNCTPMVQVLLLRFEMT
ncbi:hypothetical protein PO909_009029 [Leuciscus waleckii]